MIARAAENYAEAANRKGGLDALKRDNKGVWQFGEDLKALFESHTTFTKAEKEAHERREGLFAALEQKRREGTLSKDVPSK
ncbi:MAG: hypothetical protein KBF47_16435 [Gemmatimonadales bacterium]|jgi:hypothetical protein|nr:hypothetical protein [Gemmatimonadales bacterium]